MRIQELLAYEMNICQTHVNRLELAIQRIGFLYPFKVNEIENMKDEDVGFLELLTARLSKLQDCLGEKVFNYILQLLGESTENKSYIDKLLRLEKLEILPSVEWWQELRKLRNILIHEYPNEPEILIEALNKAFVHAKRLIIFFQGLKDFIMEKQLSQVMLKI